MEYMVNAHRQFEDFEVAPYSGVLLFLDVDGTLVVDNKADPSQMVQKKVAELAKVAKVYICSNSLNRKRNEEIALMLQLPLIREHRKPNPAILNQIPKKELELPRVVVGDKCLTDGLFALRIGAKFIKVERKIGEERFHIKLYNLIDDIAYTVLKYFV